MLNILYAIYDIILHIYRKIRNMLIGMKCKKKSFVDAGLIER